MRKDICHFYPNQPIDVYDAYLNAIKDKFNKSCEATPYHTITFGLNFSFKYNMNGGVCNVHIIPYNEGTAVDVRYTIMQAMGARYTAHNKDLTECVEKLLGTHAHELDLDIETFLQNENQVKVAMPTKEAITIPPQAPVSQSTPLQQSARFCSQCGHRFGESDRFCCNCGNKR